MYHYIEPEVAGGLGVNTVADYSVHPPVVSVLHYELEGWLGDDLLETFPCFVVTSHLKDKLNSTTLSGFEFHPVELTISEKFKQIYPDRKIPEFFWFKVVGLVNVDDFWINNDYILTVSEKALSVLKSCNISHAEVE